MGTEQSPQKFDTYLNSWSDLARARRELTVARNRRRKIRERYEQAHAKAEADIKRAEAKVEYLKKIAAAEEAAI